MVLTLAGITCVMGVLYALMQHDLKRLLAYHTVENIGIIFIGLGLALAFKAYGMAWAAALALHRRPAARLQSFLVQEPVVLRRRRRAQQHRRARHGASRRADSPHAADRIRIPDRLRSDLRAAAAQRLRIGVADLPGHPAEPATALMGIEVSGARRGSAARAFRGARRGLLRQGFRRDVPRPPAQRRRRHRAGDRPLLAGGDVCFRRALPASQASCRACSSTRWRPVVQALVGDRMPAQTGVEWLSIVPIAQSRSSYNGLLVFLFMLISGALAAARSTGSPPTGCGAPRPGIAAIPIQVLRPSTRLRASPNLFAGCSAKWSFFARENGRDAAARATRVRRD